MIKQTNRLMAVLSCLAILFAPIEALGASQAMLELLRILHEKGSLSDMEYQAVLAVANAETDATRSRAAINSELENHIVALPAITTKDKIEITSSDGEFKWKPIGRVMVDYNGFDSDTDGAPLGSGWEMRRARLGMETTLWDHWIGKLEVDFGSTKESISVKDAYVGYKDRTEAINWWVKVGQQHVPFGWESMSSSKYMTFINRAAYADGVLQDSRLLGISGLAHGRNDRWTLHGGVFGGSTAEDPDSCGAANGECDEQWNVATRVTGLPFLMDKNHLLHLGAGLWYRLPHGSAINIEQRHGAFHVIDSKPWQADFGTAVDSVLAYNLETVGIFGSGYFKAEYVNWDVNMDRANSFTDDVTLDGWSLEAGFFLTGESKAYSFSKAQFDSIKPKGIVGKGGLGAWELA